MKTKNQLIQSLKSYLAASKINTKGKSVKEKIVLIESDDWGAIRTPSAAAVKAFEQKGLEIAQSIYRNDALESQDDLELLFEVLSKHKGSDGQPAKMTANAIMANPDFDKIKASGYTEFHYEKFTDTFQKYPNHGNNLTLWKQGQSENIFQPQFHGREHLNYKRWLRVLQQKNEAALFCFDHNATYSGKEDYSFMEAYDWDSKDDIPEQIQVIEDGFRIFKDTFGETSKSFIAPCYNWDPMIEPALKNQGVTWLQGISSQLVPTGVFDRYDPIRHRFAEENHLGLRYNVRNCIFEPSMNQQRDWVNSCLAQVASAFHWNKPAVICAHRINFVGYIDPKNRDRGLKDLDVLLRSITKKWPDARFISTDQLDAFLN
ncbi:hypothetical protein G4D82_04365 [Flavobacterium sp. CYK-4]|uniref:hypothetical protein n=1 Tax=Flavobacterium lotistagni TaxID=2709660 RepID=UPI00140D372E|nr:hypothetical protein [Flavobacterium lotistagni]NHM06445.1 hypothetical protein [Flavobacterium lotistagni]